MRSHRHKVANALLRAGESAAERLYGAVVSWPRPALEVTDLEELGAEVDELAAASANFAPCIRVRDSGGYLRWLWLENRMAPTGACARCAGATARSAASP